MSQTQTPDQFLMGIRMTAKSPPQTAKYRARGSVFIISHSADYLCLGLFQHVADHIVQDTTVLVIS